MSFYICLTHLTTTTYLLSLFIYILLSVFTCLSLIPSSQVFIYIIQNWTKYTFSKLNVKLIFSSFTSNEYDSNINTLKYVCYWQINFILHWFWSQDTHMYEDNAWELHQGTFQYYKIQILKYTCKQISIYEIASFVKCFLGLCWLLKSLKHFDIANLLKCWECLNFQSIFPKFETAAINQTKSLVEIEYIYTI